MVRISAGLLMYRLLEGRIEVLIGHPGGPLFRKKDEGHWTVPKGEVHPGEELIDAAVREFTEEVGITPEGPYLELGAIRQKGGKIVHAWGFQGQYDPALAAPTSTFKMEWPIGSGKIEEFQELDRLQFFPLPQAAIKLKDAQVPFLERLKERLAR